MKIFTKGNVAAMLDAIDDAKADAVAEAQREFGRRNVRTRAAEIIPQDRFGNRCDWYKWTQFKGTKKQVVEILGRSDVSRVFVEGSLEVRVDGEWERMDGGEWSVLVGHDPAHLQAYDEVSREGCRGFRVVQAPNTNAGQTVIVENIETGERFTNHKNDIQFISC